VLNHLSFNRSH